MAFDYSGALAASRRLSRENAALGELSRALSQYQASIDTAWDGPDRQQVDVAIERLRMKIARAQKQIDQTCQMMNAGAAALKTREDTERAEARVRSSS